MADARREPQLRVHKRSGNVYGRFDGHQVWFGPDGPAARRRFDQLKAQWLANGRRLPEEPDDDLTVADLVASYLEHASTYYRKPDGTPTGEADTIRHALRYLLRLYRDERVADFDIARLRLVRQAMVRAGLARKVVNGYVGRVVRTFGWGVEEGLVSPEVYGGLRALRGLPAGRSDARETEPVRPVAWEHVEAVLEHVAPPVAGLIELMWHTGMRPSEACRLRPADLDRSGQVWLYKVSSHKTEHHDRERIVPIGPRAQEVLWPFLLRVPSEPEKPVFRPVDAVAFQRAERRRRRRTPLWRSHEAANVRKRRRRPKRQPRECYSTDSLRRAIARACDKAKVPAWSPGQLRHSAATRLRKELGLEAARVVLGHSSAAVTEVYAELDRTRAIEAMANHG